MLTQSDSDEYITLHIPPYPVYHLSSYRCFQPHEMHITRYSNEYVLIIMFEGELNFTENDVEVCLAAGDWYIQKPFMIQSARRESNCPSYYYIHFRMVDSVDLSYSFNSSITISRRGRLSLDDTFNVKLFEAYFTELSKPITSSVLDILAHQTAFISFLRFFLQTCTTQSQTNSHSIELICEYLKSNYTDSDVSALAAKEYHYSLDYLHKLFKRDTGVSMSTYVNNLRVEKAKMLLTNTDMSIDVISREIGFNDISVFYRNFNKIIKMSPGLWRSTSRNLNKEV